MNQPATNPTSHSSPRNTLGVVGFAFSLLSIVTCGILAPVGLLLSLLALLQRPRSLATAGVVISTLATLWLGLVGASLVAAFYRLQPVIHQMTGEFTQLQATLQAVSSASREVALYRTEFGDWPDEKSGQQTVGRFQDAYGTQLRYTKVGDMALIISAGADGAFATADDISLDPLTLSGEPPAGMPLDLVE